MAQLPVPIHSYALDARQASNARLVNAYAEAAPTGGKSPLFARVSPGVLANATVGNGPGRGLLATRGTLYAVSGGTLYSVENGAATELGSIAGAGRVYMAANQSELVVVVPGVAGYVWDGTALTQITDSDFTTRSPGAVDFLDNYLLFVDQGSGRFFSSDLADAESYDALNFATAEVAPDDLVTLATNQREVILLGETSGERWYNAGSSGFPFARIPGGTFELGCVARHSAFKLDNTVGWLASDLTLRMLRGAVPTRVSQHGFEQAIRGYSRVDDCEAFTYTLDGHLCAVLRFPAAGATWIYDATTGEMHEREAVTGDLWDVCHAATVDGTVYVQRGTTGAVGVLTPETFTEFGEPLRFEITFQGIQGEGNTRLFHSRLELLCEVGQGLISGQGSDPRVTLEMSNDGGETWHTLPTRSLGAIGNYKQRVKWEALGTARHRVYRLSGADPVPFTMWGASLTASAGRS